MAVRQIFARTRIPQHMRLLLAGKGLLDADAWAAMADQLDTFRTNVTRLLTPDRLGPDEQAREATLIQLAACWRKCRALAESRDTRRACLEEDPHKIPEMGVQEYGQKRATFVANHRDVLLTDFCEPHKRFLERFDRDFTIHEVIPAYEIGEIRLKSEHIAQKNEHEGSRGMWI